MDEEQLKTVQVIYNKIQPILNEFTPDDVLNCLAGVCMHIMFFEAENSDQILEDFYKSGKEYFKKLRDSTL